MIYLFASTLTFFLCWTCVLSQLHYIQIFTGNSYLPSLFFNVSLGLYHDDHNVGRQCKGAQDSSTSMKLMTFTPNRLSQQSSIEDALQQRVRLLFILAVGGHSDSYYNYGPAGSLNGLLAVWDSWKDNFFSVTSNTTSLLLLFDERDFLRQNYTTSKSEYLNSILIKNMGAQPVRCLKLRSSQQNQHRRHRTHEPHQRFEKHSRGHCSNELQFDQTYRVYYVNYANTTHSNQMPLIIFAAVHKFPVPDWAKDEDEDQLFKTWKPWRLNKRYPTNYGYVKMTNWYSYHMLQLQILDFFEYGGKLDNDVSFVAPFPEANLPLKLAQSESLMLVSADGWYYDDPRICQGVSACMKGFIDKELSHCKNVGGKESKVDQLVAGGANNPTFWETSFNTTFRAHFLVFWFGLYASPECILLARHWNDWHPRGMWDFRWGDQQWWPRPIAMYGTGNLSKEVFHYNEINTENNKYVVHKLWPRWGTIPKVMYFNYNGSTKEQRDQLYQIAAKPFIY